MALIRNFPVPSDRMAIISTLLNIEDAVVLEYGPEGTTHFSMNFFNKLGQDYPDRLFTTGVDDSDIIMGSTEHLERGILELDALYSPKAIFVLTSSVTSIIVRILRESATAAEQGSEQADSCKYLRFGRRLQRRVAKNLSAAGRAVCTA